MNRMRILGAVCASLLASSLGAIAACGGTQDASENQVSTAQAVTAANVSIALFDESGAQVGTGSGVMIAPKLVLTSGHLIAGKYKWVVTSADGKQTATGKRGLTYDWRTYDSDKAHPRRHDVGVIHLEDGIKLPSYPKLVSDATASGAQATRVRSNLGGFEQKDATLTKVRSAPNAWLVDGAQNETVSTGGVVFDGRGILGVVSGRGTTTGKLYVARIDRLVKWLSPKVACASASKVRTYSEPEVDKSKEDCDGGTTDSTDSTGSNPNGDSANGNPNGGSGDSGSGDTCSTNNDGVCNGSCAGASESDSSSGGSASNSGNSGDSNSDSANSGSDDSTGSGDSTGTGTGNPGSSDTTGSTGNDGSSNSDSANSNGDSTNGSQTGSAGGGGKKGNLHFGPVYWPKLNDGVSDGNEACQGPEDNADVCPTEVSGCKGSDCGGGTPDDTIDYGDCACGSKKKGGSSGLR